MRRRQWRQGRSGEDGDGQGVAAKPRLGKGGPVDAWWGILVLW